jgi:MarR family transcriptional regulator, temperature-dependent positive regulator of motility
MTTPNANEYSLNVSQLELLRVLDMRQRVSQREVALSLGVSLGKVNYCLKALIEKGFIKAANYRNSSNKLAYFYILTPSGMIAKTELTRQYLAQKVREYDALGTEIQRLQAESQSAATPGEHPVP